MIDVAVMYPQGTLVWDDIGLICNMCRGDKKGRACRLHMYSQR